MDAPVVDPAAEHEAVEPRSRPATGEAQVTVEHRARLAAALGLAAAAVTVAWFSRALQTGLLVDWLVSGVLAVVGLVQLAVLRDSRAPLLVADDQGVRVRHGLTWSGLDWHDIDHVELEGYAVEGRRGRFRWLRDGRIVVHPVQFDDPDVPGSDLEAFSVPVGPTTRVITGPTGELLADLDLLASGRAPVVTLTGEVDDEEPEDGEGDLGQLDHREVEAEPEPELGEDRGFDRLNHREVEEEVEEASEEDVREEFEPVAPARPPAPAVRAEIVREPVRVVASAPALPEQRGGEPVMVARLDDVAPFAGPEPWAARPAADPVIGPMIAAARHRARLSIDQLSERTRIRPHVLECIEVDDFEPCGGDFYARGHLRTLARIFGLDPQELLEPFDERYAHGEIDARQVFEAELATGIGGGVRAAAGGPRWSLLAAAVIALGLVWGGARVFTDTPEQLVSPAPGVVDSAGLASGDQTESPATTLAPLSFTAVGATPQVVVRDRTGRILWAGELAAGQHQQVIGQAPFSVTASNGAAVKVSYLGKPRGTVGSTSAADSREFG